MNHSTKRRGGIRTRLFVALLVAAALQITPRAQEAPAVEPMVSAFIAEWPAVNALLTKLEHANAAWLGILGQQRSQVQESEALELLMRRVTEDIPNPDSEAEAGYATLGPRGAEVVKRTQAFHREILAIFASVAPDDRIDAIDEAVARYRSQPEVAFPDIGKDMDILYDHPYAWRIADDSQIAYDIQAPYPLLNGFVWATHWFQLAAMEPFEESLDIEGRSQGLEVITDRFNRKLKAGELPDAFPEELPLSAPIAPSLVLIHPPAAAIIDNMHMMQDVVADILVSSEVGDDELRAKLDQVIDEFIDPEFRVLEEDDWLLMALRHSIFSQGGPALGDMTESERNLSGHAQHSGGGRASIPGMGSGPF